MEEATTKELTTTDLAAAALGAIVLGMVYAIIKHGFVLEGGGCTFAGGEAAVKMASKGRAR